MKPRFKFYYPLLAILFLSCTASFDPVKYGKDQCHHCKMTIMDKRYACEILDQKGKAFKFDDIVCLRDHMSEKKLEEADLKVFVAPYLSNTEIFLDGKKAVYLHHSHFKSPMNGDISAFASEAEAAPLRDSLGITALGWDKLGQ